MRKATREAILKTGDTLAGIVKYLDGTYGDPLTKEYKAYMRRVVGKWYSALSQYRADVAASKRPKKKARGR
jgi:hypothetical protein